MPVEGMNSGVLACNNKTSRHRRVTLVFAGGAEGGGAMSGALVDVLANRLRVRAPRRLGGLAGRGVYSKAYCWSGLHMTGSAAGTVSGTALSGLSTNKVNSNWSPISAGRALLDPGPLLDALVSPPLARSPRLSPLLAPRTSTGRLLTVR